MRLKSGDPISQAETNGRPRVKVRMWNSVTCTCASSCLPNSEEPCFPLSTNLWENLFRLICSRAGAKALFIDHVSPQTRLLEKRRQVFEVEEALEAQKEEYSRREVSRSSKSIVIALSCFA